MKTAFSDPMPYKASLFTNRWFYEVLPDNSWEGESCFIIGGGPSLKDFDWSKLKGKKTIGINKAFVKFEPTIIFSMDTRFLNWLLQGKYGQEAIMKFEKSKSYKVLLCTYVQQPPSYIFIISVYKNYNEGLRAFTFSMKEGLGHGDNSGYGALNLACVLGANPIYLLGIDCKHENGRSHWHEGHPAKQAAETAKGFIPRFTKYAAPKIKERQIQVVNLNPDSALDCFPKMRPEEVL